MTSRTAADSADPRSLERNPDNPRLIFRAEDLQSLQDSIESQGVLVPLTVYRDGRKLVILDGERRWRCALKLGLTSVPVIIQPKPDRLQNIMMMFAIHNARTDWDPLPTAYKLRELEEEYERSKGRRPTEVELSQLASLNRGEVRRLKRLLALPDEYQDELMAELEKPRHEQQITVDHVLEAQKGASSLRSRAIIDEKQEDQLRRALLEKFRNRTIRNTVAPRQLARIGRAVDREEISVASARRVANRLITDPAYTIDQAFRDSAAQFDFQHGLDQLISRAIRQLDELQELEYELSPELVDSLSRLRSILDAILPR